MLDFHPVANIFPLMTGAEYDALVSDIAEHGQHEAIWLYEGKVLDGRNRLRACNQLGLVPEFREYSGDDPQAFVVSLNLHRRHLTREQRDEVIRQLRGNGMTLQKIADAMGVSLKTAHRAASDLSFDNSEIVNERGQMRPMHYAARTVELEPEEEELDHTRALAFMADNVSLGLTPTGEYEPKQRAQQAMGATVYSHNSLDYYTPQYVTDAARAVMGGIDLDPASCEMAQAWIKAGRYYTITDDGLSKPWAGRVWLNPPYSYTDGRSNQDLWSERLITEYNSGNVQEGLLLVKAALGYKWFERLWDVWPVCFMRERLSFVMADGSDDGQSKQATAIFYIGPNVSKFVDVFRLLGRVILPEDQKYG